MRLSRVLQHMLISDLVVLIGITSFSGVIILFNPPTERAGRRRVRALNIRVVKRGGGTSSWDQTDKTSSAQPPLIHKTSSHQPYHYYHDPKTLNANDAGAQRRQAVKTPMFDDGIGVPIV